LNLFDLEPGLVYLNHAAVSPWPRETVEAVTRFARENGRLGSSRYPEWLACEHELRGLFAELINAPSGDDIALLKSTSEGLSVIAHGLPWEPGDNIVTIAQEFPSNRIVWQSLLALGVEIRPLDLSHSEAPEADLIGLCDERTRLLTVSSVQYASGLRLDLGQLGRYCRAHDILFCIDAIQSLGAIAFDLEESLADFVVADGHKWMLGPEGIALFYCRAELRDRLTLHQYGWHMVEEAGDFERQQWQPASTARRFECGSPNMLGIHALQASLGLIHRIGTAEIQQCIEHLTQEIITRVDEMGFELLSPREPQRRAGIVTFRIAGADHQALYKRLMQMRVICAPRGGGMRFSPHFYNRQEEIHSAFERLTSLL
jgi:selenocysteine lyase/cysteine desulfurase